MDTADLFSTRIQKSFDDDQAEILSILKANPHAKLKLINYYKGMPIAYPAFIVSVERGILDLEVKPEQAFAIEHSRSAFIRCPLFKYDVFARAQYANAKREAASFNRFSYAELVAEQRNFIRVVPDPYPHVQIHSSSGVIEGKVDDVSLTGVSVLIDYSCDLERGMELPINFVLKNVEHPEPINVKLPARLVAIKGDKLPREYKFAIDPGKTLEQQLSQYIIQRQIEIIKELKQAVAHG
jgi:hypothetical protein